MGRFAPERIHSRDRRSLPCTVSLGVTPFGLFCRLQPATFATSLRSNAAEEEPLAIKGYDPVAYFTDGKPTRGLPEYEYQWDEHRYRFASAEHRDLFKADPVRYAPQFGNYCAMSLAGGEIVEANPENWLISDGKLYIFGKSIGPDLFQRNLAENVARANRNRDLIKKH